MSQSIEEEKQVPAKDASALTAGGSESQEIIKITIGHIDEYKKLKLIYAVNLGLTVEKAGEVVCMATPTARQVIKKYKQSKNSTPEVNYEKDKDLMDKVELDCMLDVIESREKGNIGKSNLIKMDKKLNGRIRKIIDRYVPSKELTLPEKMKDSSEKKLPRPNFDVRPLGKYSEDPKDLAHWKNLPKNVKKHERKRMHCFLFNKTKKFEHKSENFLPSKFFK